MTPEQALREEITRAGITDINTVAMILAQCAHETAYFKKLEENLNYSAEGLRRVFKKHFSLFHAMLYARKPQKIANRAYANRMGNGDEKSGDGWKYRGRGLCHLTGRSNYASATKALKVDLINNPDALLEPKIAAKCAVWFLMGKPGFRFGAKRGDVKECTLQVNGGYNGLAERTKLFDDYLTILKGQKNA